MFLTESNKLLDQIPLNSVLRSILSTNSKSLKEKVSQLLKNYNNLNKYTQNIQQKVDNLLKAQQKQFINGYIHHMKKIDEQFQELNKVIKQQQQKIAYYETQGTNSIMIKKITKLQIENANIYKQLAKRQLTIRKLQNSNKTFIAQLKRTEKFVMELKKQKIVRSEISPLDFHIETTPSLNILTKRSPSERKSQITYNEPITQISGDKSLKLAKQFTLLNSSRQKSSSELFTLGRQVTDLKKKNKILQRQHTYSIQKHIEAQQFFIRSINDIKKLIQIKKKINYCSYEDFSKEDKVNLLICVLSNEQILQIIYQSIFSKKIHQHKRINTQTNQKSKIFFPNINH